MRSWMRSFLFSVFLFYSSLAYSECKFKPHVTKVYSLSGVTSVALNEIGLLKNPAVKGISVFNPISKNDFIGTRYPGGIFLSPTVFKEFGGGVVFYDESLELSRVLDPMSSIQGVQIKTRGLTPTAVSEYVVKELKFFLDGCEKEVGRFLLKTKTTATSLQKNTPKTRTAVYYLGDKLNGKHPEMIMVQDGVVKWLIEQKLIRSYPSPLAYVNWSAKIMRSLPKETLHIHLVDSGAQMIKNVQGKYGNWTLTYPGALVPGLTQLEAWNYFEEMATP